MFHLKMHIFLLIRPETWCAMNVTVFYQFVYSLNVCWKIFNSLTLWLAKCQVRDGAPNSETEDVIMCCLVRANACLRGQWQMCMEWWLAGKDLRNLVGGKSSPMTPCQPHEKSPGSQPDTPHREPSGLWNGINIYIFLYVQLTPPVMVFTCLGIFLFGQWQVRVIATSRQDFHLILSNHIIMKIMGAYSFMQDMNHHVNLNIPQWCRILVLSGVREG
jgi:hypothetical protein